MTEATFRLRRGTADDTRPAFDLFVESVRDLTARNGIPWDPDVDGMWGRLTPLLERLETHAAEWWVAEDVARGEVIGHARSIERRGLFELTEFFVLPGRQSAGVGAALLDRAFPADRGEVRAIIATTDMRAQARYYRAGTVARFPIVGVSGAPRPSDAPPGIEVVRAGTEQIEEMVRLERAVIEFDRGDEYAWLLEHREGYLYRRGDAAIGFGFVSPSATGPVVAAEPADQAPILAHLETRGAEMGIEQLSFEVPMVNDTAMRHLLDRGFRLDPFYTFLMSSRPFGRFDRFIGFAPPFFL